MFSIQFLNGVLYETSSVPECFVYEIFDNAEDLELELYSPEQITLIQSEEDSNRWYGFIRPLPEISLISAMDSFCCLPHEKREVAISRFLQKLSSERKVVFMCHPESDGTKYEIYGRAEDGYNIAERICVVTTKPSFTPIQDGVYKHWVTIEDQEYEVQTILDDQQSIATNLQELIGLCDDYFCNESFETVVIAY